MIPSKRILSAEFYVDEGQWHPTYYPTTNIKLERLKFITFNTWFDDYFLRSRVDAIVNILQESHADIVALQEITNKSLAIILQSEWIRRNYFVSDASGATLYHYGVVLLSRMPIKQLKIYSLTSVMGRRFLSAEFLVNGAKLLVGTAHLESLRESEGVRATQLAEVFEILEAADNAIFMGDFNFCASWAENTNIDDEYLDLWDVLRPDEMGYTEDTDINMMRKQLKREGNYSAPHPHERWPFSLKQQV